MVQVKLFHGTGIDGIEKFGKDINNFMSEMATCGFEYKDLVMSTQYVPVRPPVTSTKDEFSFLPLFVAALSYEVGNHMAGDEINGNENSGLKLCEVESEEKDE